jgi:hypothetical protein
MSNRPSQFEISEAKFHVFHIEQTEVGERAMLGIMPPLLFVCPKTNKRVPTGIETDVQNLQAFWKETLKVKCPHCSEMHEISVRETYINSALSDAADRLTA